MAMSVNVGHVFTMFILVAGIAVIYASEQVEVRTTHLGYLLVDNASHTFGNDVKYRSHRLTKGAHRTFIDTNNQLPSGLLSNFYIFLTDKESAEKDSEYIRLQIWRYKSNIDKHTLVWERRILFTLYDKATIYDIDVSLTGFNVQSGDVIGWTNELDISSLVFKDSSRHFTHHKSIVNNPILEQSYRFSDKYPAEFSIAVKIDETNTTETTSASGLTTPVYNSSTLEVRTTHLGYLLVDNASHTFGNDVTYRSHRLTKGAHRTFIDTNNQLPSGLLSNFYIFLTDKESAEKDSEYIRLQIWRYKSNIDKHTLVWERRILFTLYDKATIYDIDVSSTGFNVQSGDVIGWTNEFDISSLVFNDSSRHFTHHKSIVNNPILEESYRFSDKYPAEFSIAVKIDETNTTESTSASGLTTPVYNSSTLVIRTTHLGNLLVDNENHTFGNDVTHRSHLVAQGAHRSFIDTNNRLPSGLLSNFYIFLTDKESAEMDSEYIRLQIWRYKSIVDKYTLVWEQRILFTLYDTGTFYDIDVSSLGFNVQAGDFIGWTNELDSSALVFKVVENHGTYHKSNVILPILEESFTFSHTYSGQFSIAVRIEIDETTLELTRPVITSSTSPIARKDTTKVDRGTTTKLSASGITTTVYNGSTCFNSNYLISLAMVACLSFLRLWSGTQ